MGWCQEFAQQIRPGCDHLMLAGAASCSCDECGTVCPGRFRGCASVWAAGPQPVSLSGPASPGGRVGPALVPAAADNGNGNGTYVGSEPHGGPVPTPPAADWGAEVRAELAALRTQMEELSRKVDGVSADKAVSDAALLKVARASETLPERIGRSLTAALREQNDSVLTELEVVNAKLSAHIDGVAKTPPSTRGDAELLREIDTRFEWLVMSLSDRLVLIGNEVARLQKQVSAAIPATNRAAPGGTETMVDSAQTRTGR